MEPHPIPQNVTSFEFHLVGDMTLKQFLYLATGAGIAYVLFVFFAPLYPSIAWPLILISASVGAAFAFLGIASRPLDSWLAAFLTAIYSPTKRVWSKNKQTYKEYPLFTNRLATYLSSLQPIPPSHGVVEPQSQGVSLTLPSIDELGKAVTLARQAQNIQIRIIQTERTLSQIKFQASHQTPTPYDYSQQVNKIIADLQNLVSQASQIRQQLDAVTQPEQVKQPPPAKASMKTVVKVVAVPTKKTQVALTTFPNVINGVVTDNSGNYLEGCIAVIYDREGLPVRALKTNKLGQFTGSTPLPNGTYKLAVEKDSHTFDALQVELSGAVLPPLMITSK